MPMDAVPQKKDFKSPVVYIGEITRTMSGIVHIYLGDMVGHLKVLILGPEIG